LESDTNTHKKKHKKIEEKKTKTKKKQLAEGQIIKEIMNQAINTRDLK